MKNWWKYCASLWLLLPLLASAQKVEVQSILIFGLKKTKQEVVLREMTFKVGDSLEVSRLDEIQEQNQNNIYNLSLFTKVELTHEMGPDGVNFTFQVQERWYVWPSPYVALEERTFNEWWQDKDLDRLVYGVGVSWENFTGWRDNMTAYVQLGYSRRVSLSYSRPWLFPKRQLNGSVFFQYINNKEIGYGTRNGVLQLARLADDPMRKSYVALARLGKRFSPRKQLYLDLSYNYFRPNDSIRFFNDKYLTTNTGAEQYPSIGLTFVNDQRDLRSFPMDGYKYGAIVRHSGLPGIGTTMFTKISMAFSHHIPLSRRWNFAYGTQNMFMIGKRVPYFDKFFVGFNNVIRGYENYVIDGSFVNMTKAEVKFAILPRKMFHIKQVPFKRFRDFPLGIYLSAYADGGYVSDNTFNNTDNYLKNTTLLGYGVGLNVITIYDALVRVEYSFNQLGGQGLFLHFTVSIR